MLSDISNLLRALSTERQGNFNLRKEMEKARFDLERLQYAVQRPFAASELAIEVNRGLLLEQELSKTQRERDEIKVKLGEVLFTTSPDENDRLRQQLSQVQAERDALRLALLQVQCDCKNGSLDHSIYTLDQIDKALVNPNAR